MTSTTNAIQQLNQSICQRFGWGIEFSNESDGKLSKWFCNVWVGMNDKRCFATDHSYPDTITGMKEGKTSVAALALERLQQVIQYHESLPVKALCDVFPQPIQIYESNEHSWNYFWQHRPDIVGIDTEGNQIVPPVLIQISTNNYVILEVPIRGQLSKGLMKLLSDDKVIKVFCDNGGHKDKISLGINLPDDEADMISGSIVDIEVMANVGLGPCKSKRGISKLVTLVMPELLVRIEKGNSKKGSKRVKDVFRFCMIEQGKAPPLRSIHDLTSIEKQYAALDAWITLQIYRRLLMTSD